jgi:hypothetical protein
VTADGMIWHSTPRATVGLVVKDGVVVEPCAPYARPWALGKDGRALWRAAAQRRLHGVLVEWLPDEPLDSPNRSDLAKED